MSTRGPFLEKFGKFSYRTACPILRRHVHARPCWTKTRSCATPQASNSPGIDTFTVTTPLYYVNAGLLNLNSCIVSYIPLYVFCAAQHARSCELVSAAAPHMGSAYPTIAADAISRYQVGSYYSQLSHKLTATL